MKINILNKSHRALSIVISTMLFSSMILLPCISFASTKVTKEESVYVITKGSGKEEKVIVSDHLVNNAKLEKIQDVSDLIDIENVKGDETFEQDGANFTWNAEGNDIFYQGTTINRVPIKMSISYFVDGEKFTGKEMQGKRGNFKIVMDYTNSAVANGVKVPLFVLSGLMFDNKNYSDIAVDGGKAINNGDTTIATGIAVPGIDEIMGASSKKMTDNLDFGDQVTITGKTNKFDITDIMSIATTTPSDIEASDLNDLNFDTEINQLDSGARKLVEGSQKLQNGIYSLNKKTPALAQGISQLSGGLNGLNTSITTLGDGVAQLKTGSDALVTLLQPYSMTTMMNHATKSPSIELKKTNELLDELEEKGEVSEEACEKIKATIQTELKKNEKMKASPVTLDPIMQQIKGIANSLNENLTAMDIKINGANPTNPGSNSLKGGVGALAKGANTLNSQTGQLKAGVNKLANGSKTLSLGAEKLYNDGISKIVKLYKGEFKELKKMLQKVGDAFEAGKDYRTFTKISPNMDGNVKFIFKTAVDK